MTRLLSALFFCLFASSLFGANVSLTTGALALTPGAGLLELDFTSADNADGTFGLFAVLGTNNSVWVDNQPIATNRQYANTSIGGRARIGEITATNGITDGPILIGVISDDPSPPITENLTGWQLLLQIDREAGSGTVAIDSAILPSNYILAGINDGLSTPADPVGFFALDFDDRPLPQGQGVQVPVPEPAAVIMAYLGLAALLTWRPRR